MVGVLLLAYIINIADVRTLHITLNSIPYSPTFVVEMLSQGSWYP
jgi:hypothetical protein